MVRKDELKTIGVPGHVSIVLSDVLCQRILGVAAGGVKKRFNVDQGGGNDVSVVVSE
jgi:hypothetical protein